MKIDLCRSKTRLEVLPKRQANIDLESLTFPGFRVTAVTPHVIVMWKEKTHISLYKSGKIMMTLTPEAEALAKEIYKIAGVEP